MAKKKLTPYEKAQRQFVRARLQETGKEKSPETRQRFRQRFDTLAAEKEGRTRLAQKLLPGEGAEERRNFKRMLATDLPGRTGTGGTGTSGTGTSGTGTGPTGTGGTGPVAKSWQEALRGGIPATPKTTTTTTSQTTTQSSTKGPNAFQNRRNNIIGQGINYPGRTVVDSFANPLGSLGAITDFSAKGLAKVAGQELAEAAILVQPGARLAAGTLKATIAVGRFGLRTLGRLNPNLGQQGINKLGGTGKVPYGPPAPTAPRGQLALNPGSAARLNARGGVGRKPYGPNVPAASTGRAVTAQRTARLNKQGGVGGKPYGPSAPAATTKAATTKAATTKAQTKTKTSPSKSEVEQAEANFVKEFGQPKYGAPGQAPKGPTGKGPTNKGPQKNKEQLDDEAYNVAQMKNRFPGAKEKDAPFVAKLNRAQDAIEKQSAGYQNYATWLRNPQTQATIARLKRKK